MAACAAASLPCLRLSKPERASVAVECCYQNTAIATAVALSMFDDAGEAATAVAVPVMYGVAEIVAIAVFLLAAWRLGWTYAPATDPCCAVVLRSYQHHAGAAHLEVQPPGGAPTVGMEYYYRRNDDRFELPSSFLAEPDDADVEQSVASDSPDGTKAAGQGE